MFVRRSAVALARQGLTRPAASRAFCLSAVRREAKDKEAQDAIDLFESGGHKYKRLKDIKTSEDLLPPGAKPGTIPTDLENATGLERLEILAKMEGIDFFDMKPLDSSRVGTMDDPIIVNSFGDEQYCGCTGCPADSHIVRWLTISRKRPIERCTECGSVYKINYLGPTEDPHEHDHGHDHHDPDIHPYEEPKTFADYVKPEYYYR